MTKAEAIDAMRQGKKVTHRHFTSEEYMYMPDPRRNKYKFEDGVECSAIEFWRYREDPSYETDWSIQEEAPTGTVAETLSNIVEQDKQKVYKFRNHHAESAPKEENGPVLQPVRSTPKIHNNEPCACGSGKKYKKCCK